MKRLFTYLLSAIMIVAVGCTEGFDDSAIWDKFGEIEESIRDHEKRISALEELCKEMNTNISSLSDIVKALQNNDYVTNIAPITEDGKVVGYTITFSKSGSVTIYHGKDGQDGVDGYTPVIGVAKDTDDIYYWTLDGDWLLDKDGNKVKAEGKDGIDGEDGQNGTDGKNGKDGITPKLKIENGYWLISYDNGSTWQELGKATGEDGKGDSMFEDVTYDDDYVYITLTDGSFLTIPRRKIASNEIWYTTTDEKVVTPFLTGAFGANIISNEYKHGKGIITFDADVTKIGGGAFWECSSLLSIELPKGVKKIETRAFYDCTYLTQIIIPNSVTDIGNEAFLQCYRLKSISIPNGVTEIKDGVFYDCQSLTNITIPNGVTKIGVEAFSGCMSLSSISIPNGVTEIGGAAFGRCHKLTDIIIPEGIAEIQAGLFVDCMSLTYITIPNGVTKIGDSAFAGCSLLGGINIPDGVLEIGASAFSSCPMLSNVTIPASVATIGRGAFFDCSSLNSIYCKGLTPPALLHKDVFYNNMSSRKIYVPMTSVNIYKTTEVWKDYAENIEGYDYE